MSAGYVYILTNKKDGILYIGVTSDLVRRVYEHKKKMLEGFSKKYNLTNLVYYETHIDIVEAIKREKQLKKWKREYKLDLITKFNSGWKDLYDSIL